MEFKLGSGVRAVLEKPVLNGRSVVAGVRLRSGEEVDLAMVISVVVGQAQVAPTTTTTTTTVPTTVVPDTTVPPTTAAVTTTTP